MHHVVMSNIVQTVHPCIDHVRCEPWIRRFTCPVSCGEQMTFGCVWAFADSSREDMDVSCAAQGNVEARVVWQCMHTLGLMCALWMALRCHVTLCSQMTFGYVVSVT